jgi:hypothetical protein
MKGSAHHHPTPAREGHEKLAGGCHCCVSNPCVDPDPRETRSRVMMGGYYLSLVFQPTGNGLVL